MSSEERMARIECATTSIISDLAGIKVELRWIRYIMLAILGVLLKNTFWPG